MNAVSDLSPELNNVLLAAVFRAAAAAGLTGRALDRLPARLFAPRRPDWGRVLESIAAAAPADFGAAPIPTREGPNIKIHDDRVLECPLGGYTARGVAAVR